MNESRRSLVSSFWLMSLLKSGSHCGPWEFLNSPMIPDEPNIRGLVSAIRIPSLKSFSFSHESP